MKSARKIKLSIFKELRGRFEDGSMMGVPFNVYDESDMRAGTVPVWPYVYLFDYGVPFNVSHLPFIIISVVVGKTAFELGNDALKVYLTVFVMGTNRGERDDIASAIMEEISSFTICDFDYENEPTVDTVGLEENQYGDSWTMESTALPFDIQEEGTLSNWNSLSTQFKVLRTSL